VLGITDYFTVEGYRKVREYKAQGRLPNVLLGMEVCNLCLSLDTGSLCSPKSGSPPRYQRHSTDMSFVRNAHFAINRYRS
jgi:hypothetical protein